MAQYKEQFPVGKNVRVYFKKKTDQEAEKESYRAILIPGANKYHYLFPIVGLTLSLLFLYLALVQVFDINKLIGSKHYRG